MTSLKPSISIETFRSGLLAALGHDLRLALGAFTIALEGPTLSAELDLRSLRVQGAMTRGRLDETLPSARDRAEIERSIASTVLDVSRFATATFTARVTAQASAFVLEGELRVRDRVQPLRMLASPVGEALQARVELVPSRLGIAPFRALGGALKIQDRVLVTIELPIANVQPSLDALRGLAGTEHARARWSSP